MLGGSLLKTPCNGSESLMDNVLLLLDVVWAVSYASLTAGALILTAKCWIINSRNRLL